MGIKLFHELGWGCVCLYGFPHLQAISHHYSIVHLTIYNLYNLTSYRDVQSEYHLNKVAFTQLLKTQTISDLFHRFWTRTLSALQLPHITVNT